MKTLPKTIVNKFKRKSQEIRKLILEISHSAQVGHIGSALSIADIITVLYFGVLKVNPKQVKAGSRDRFILSKGHAVAALFSALYLRGFFNKKTLFSYCKNNGRLGEHPEFFTPGVEMTSGSLGHGLSVGVGMSLAAKIDNKKYKTYVLLSDAECNEGEIWQAALSAYQLNLNNLVAIIDYNKVQALGATREVLNLEPLVEKWASFGWNAIEVDGHNLADLYLQFQRLKKDQNRPTVIIAHTTRGKGVSFMEHKIEWHYITTSEEQHKKALKEIMS